MKVKIKQIFFLILICLSIGVTAGCAPPDEKNPEEVLRKAQLDAREGRYKEALEKHIWFHENALKYERSLYGVRLSFALAYWYELAQVYPPALDALKGARDKAKNDVVKGKNTYDSFNDYESINKILNEDQGTVDFFVWLDKNRPEIAKEVYRLAEPTLVNAQKYKLCGKYIDPENSYLREVRNFQSTLAFSKEYKSPDAENFAYTGFANNVATLVALLILNERKSEAEDIVEMALLEWDDNDFSALLDDALKGNVPPPWP